jgi:hypothetical protein
MRIVESALGIAADTGPWLRLAQYERVARAAGNAIRGALLNPTLPRPKAGIARGLCFLKSPKYKAQKRPKNSRSSSAYIYL